MEIKMNDGLVVDCQVWSADQPKASLLLIHGMAEHIIRYDEFANYLSNQGIQVYGYDQRGHGKTAGSVENLGYLGEGGWSSVVDDVVVVVEKIKTLSPECPIFLMGHSMGSFVVRDYASLHSDKIQGLILSGTGASAGVQGHILTGLAFLQKKIKGPKYSSQLIDGLTTKTFNQRIKPLRTLCDWLSYDESQVDLYVNDPYCGTCFSTSFFEYLFKAVERVNSVKVVDKMKKDLPVFIFSGDEDPVGTYGKGVKKVAELFKICGLAYVEMKLYPHARHETLNEIEKTTVYSDVNTWVQSKI